MKLLFVLNHAGYLRHYREVILELARRGKRVIVAFTTVRPGDAEVFAAAFAGTTGLTLSAVPERTGWWWAAADPIRAVRDYVHYLHPAFDAAPRVVERASARIPMLVRHLVGPRGISLRRRAFIDRSLDHVERAIPADPALRSWIRRQRPDAMFISPLIEFGYDQLHVLKAARAEGVPSAHLVASWDNLTNKSRIQILADRLMVWNDVQRQEAAELHGVPAGRVLATGAQLYDAWFVTKPTTERMAFCAALGFDPALPIILYAGSSAFVAPSEVGFARDWIERLRASADDVLRKAQILIRPHPQNAEGWPNAALHQFPGVVVRAPPHPAMANELERVAYANDLWHASAVVGLNSSVFIEAAIVGRPCLSVRTAEFEGSQLGTLHFRYLVDGGIVDLAPNHEAHFERLGSALRHGRTNAADAKRFLDAFLRPQGPASPATPILADALEETARRGTTPSRRPLLAPLILFALAPFAALYLRPRYLARRAKRLPVSAAAMRVSRP